MKRFHGSRLFRAIEVEIRENLAIHNHFDEFLFIALFVKNLAHNMLMVAVDYYWILVLSH